jgi:hypothetical protein
MTEKIRANKRPKEFDEWIAILKDNGYNYEIVIDRGYISHIYVNSVDDGEWDLDFGRIKGSRYAVLKQEIFKPVLYNGKFKKDISEAK